MSNKIIWCIRIVAVIVIIGSVGYIFKTNEEYKEAEKEYSELNQYTEVDDGENIKKINNGFTVDYKGLKALNNDYIAWIYACNGNISYPVVQSQNNSEYLSKTFVGHSNKSGTIFADMRDNDLSNYQNIIFGHCMKNGTMLARLMSYKNESYADDMPYFYIYRENEIREYKVFSVYKDLPENIVAEYVDTAESREGLYDRIKAKSDYAIAVEDNVISGSGAIVSLVTCDDKHDKYRVVVNGCLVSVTK